MADEVKAPETETVDEIKIIRDIIIGEKPKKDDFVEGESIIDCDFHVRVGTIICKDKETGVIFTEIKEKRKKQLAPIQNPEIAEQVWIKAQEQLPDIEEFERIESIKDELANMIIKNCKKKMQYVMVKQLEFLKSSPNTILPTELNYEQTIEVFEYAIAKYNGNLTKRRIKFEEERNGAK
jgi:hypothetical protein